MISKLCRYQVVENDHKKSRLKFPKQVWDGNLSIENLKFVKFELQFFSVKNSVKLKKVLFSPLVERIWVFLDQFFNTVVGDLNSRLL